MRECETGWRSLPVTMGGGDSPGTLRASRLPLRAQQELGMQRGVQVALPRGTLLPGSCSPRASGGTDLEELEALGTLGRLFPVFLLHEKQQEARQNSCDTTGTCSPLGLVPRIISGSLELVLGARATSARFCPSCHAPATHTRPGQSLSPLVTPMHFLVTQPAAGMPSRGRPGSLLTSTLKHSSVFQARGWFLQAHLRGEEGASCRRPCRRPRGLRRPRCQPHPGEPAVMG